MISLLIKLLETRKTIIGILVFIFCESNYAFTNHITNSMTPHLLKLSSIDKLVPFLPHSIWLYLTEIILCISVYFVAQNRLNIMRYIAGVIAVTITAVIIFTFFPTTFPRTYYPIPTNIDSFTLGLLNLTREVDLPTNCLPSLHVCYSCLASFVFLKEQKEKFPLFFLWAILICISTLTTKQHYFLDVIFGGIIAIIYYQLFLYLLPSQNTVRTEIQRHH
ncbi:MAG: phosphatase PAP2 family protein [Gammaproteobacteria bacterium]